LLARYKTVGFEQAAIRVHRQEEFRELKEAMVRALAPANIEGFLKRVEGAGLGVRNLEPMLAEGILENSDEELGKSGRTAAELYGNLTVSDQALIREFYLSKVEEVAPRLRAKYQKAYRYY
jgi:hypothetical protein